MTTISSTSISHRSSHVDNLAAAVETYDDKVRHYIEQNRPQGTLSELMKQMRALSPDRVVTLQQLNKALLYSDTYLRNSEEFKDYTESVLDKHATQLLGLNMLYNTMLYKSFTKSDDDTSF